MVFREREEATPGIEKVVLGATEFPFFPWLGSTEVVGKAVGNSSKEGNTGRRRRGRGAILVPASVLQIDSFSYLF